MRPETEQWLKEIIIVGFEETPEEKAAREAAEAEDKEGADEDDENDEDNEDEDQLTDKQKEILHKERKARREAERKARKLERDAKKRAEQESSDQETQDLAKAREALTKSEEKATRLQTRLRNQALDSEVVKQAMKMGFRDVDDALRLMTRDEEMVEGEDDDVTVDSDSVADALKELAEKKPHLLKDDEDEEEGSARSGSKFAGRRRKANTDEATLAELYPALGATTVKRRA